MPEPAGSLIRKPDHPVERLFVDRWSPRSFIPEPIPEADLLTLFEAVRWAPSSYNNQPWRLLYARRGTPEWPLFFDLLDAGNHWAENASVLLLFVSNTRFDHNGKPSSTHSFDCGAAWENLALQATLLGYVVHGMQGFDVEAAPRVLDIPSDFQVEAMIAIGRQGPKEALPPEVQARENPNSRRSLAETVVEGKFRASLLHAEKKH